MEQQMEKSQWNNAIRYRLDVADAMMHGKTFWDEVSEETEAPLLERYSTHNTVQKRQVDLQRAGRIMGWIGFMCSFLFLCNKNKKMS
jgi:hypothetical protein